jgi:hypothetical protein
VDATIRNTIVYDGQNGIKVYSGGALTIENVTIYGMVNDGFIAGADAGSLTARNMISVGNGGEDFDIDGPITYFGYNMYDPNNILGFDPASYQGNNQTPPASLEDLFLSIVASSENLHLEGSGHNAIDTGVNLAGSVDDDIDGDSRPIGSGWEMGADERAATGGVTVNYRSIGTDPNTIYATGNASISLGTSTVTFGGGASLPTNIGQGDKLVIGAEALYILSRDSTTQVTIQGTAASNHSSESYTISRAYNTFQAWETARQGNLVGDDRREIGVAYDDGSFSAGAAISGSTTDSTRYMKITVAAGHRHAGIAGNGVVIDAGGGAGAPLFLIEDEYTVIEWVELTNFNDGFRGVSFPESPSNANSTVSNLLIHDYTVDDARGGIGVKGSNSTIRNTIIYDGAPRGIHLNAATNPTVENCTIYNTAGTYGDAIRSLSGASGIIVRNTISVGNAGEDFQLEGGITYFGYNMYRL